MSDLETLQAQRAALEAQRAQLAEQIEAITRRIEATQAQATYERTGLRKGDLLKMSKAAFDVIYSHNPGAYTSARWGIGQVVQCDSIGETTVGIQHRVRPVRVGGIPIAIAQDMRRAYLESAQS